MTGQRQRTNNRHSFGTRKFVPTKVRTQGGFPAIFPNVIVRWFLKKEDAWLSESSGLYRKLHHDSAVLGNEDHVKSLSNIEQSTSLVVPI